MNFPSGNYPFPPDYPKPAVKNGDEILRENEYLKSEIQKTNFWNQKLQKEIESLHKQDIIRHEFLIRRDNKLYYQLKKSNNKYVQEEFFANWKVDKVIKVTYDKRYNKEESIAFVVCEKDIVVMSKKDFESKKILSYFRNAGYGINLKQDESKLAALFRNYICSYFFPIKEEVRLNFCSGWTKGESGKWIYSINPDENKYNLDAPIYKNKLALTNTQEPIKSIEMAFSALQIFKNPRHRVVILGIILYSVSFSRIKEFNVEAEKIFLINMDNNMVFDMFFNIFDSEVLSIRQKTSIIEKEIISTKDSPLILDARRCNFNEHCPQKNLELLHDVFCSGISIEYGGEKYSSQSLVFVRSSELQYILNEKDILTIEISKDNIDIDKLNISFQECKRRLGDMIMAYINYTQEIIFDYAFLERDKSENIHKALHILLFYMEKMLAQYNLDINKLLGLDINTGKYGNALNFFLKALPLHNKDMIYHFFNCLYKAVKAGHLKERFMEDKFNSDSKNSNTDSYVYISESRNEVWIKREDIDNIVIPIMGKEAFSSKNILELLKKSNMLILNEKGEYGCKRCIPGKKGERSRFVVIKREFYKRSGLIERGDENEKKTRIYWS